ncbi:MAG: YgjV family protein [Candidatus Woesearchaeota archaeon]
MSDISQLLSRPIWILYNVYYISIPSILVELFIGTSTIIAIIRFDRKKYTSKEKRRELSPY